MGTALSWKTVWPTLRGNTFRTYVFVKVVAGGELPWRKARSDDERAAIAKIQELPAQPKPPDDDFWMASDRSLAFDAKETNHDDTVDDPVPVTVYEATVGVTG